MILRLASLVLITLLGIATAPLSRAADSNGATGNHQSYDDEEIAKGPLQTSLAMVRRGCPTCW
jgi:hypothetical protein